MYLHRPAEGGRFVGSVDHLKSADQVQAGDPWLSSGPDRVDQIADLQHRLWAVPADADRRVASFLRLDWILARSCADPCQDPVGGELDRAVRPADRHVAVACW